MRLHRPDPAPQATPIAQNRRRGLALLVLVGWAMTDASDATEAHGDPLAHYRWKARVLVVLAADPASPEVIEQKRQFERLTGGAQERDLVLVQALAGSPEAKALRALTCVSARRPSGRCWLARMAGRSSAQTGRSAALNSRRRSTPCQCGRTKCANAPAFVRRRASQVGP